MDKYIWEIIHNISKVSLGAMLKLLHCYLGILIWSLYTPLCKASHIRLSLKFALAGASCTYFILVSIFLQYPYLLSGDSEEEIYSCSIWCPLCCVVSFQVGVNGSEMAKITESLFSLRLTLNLNLTWWSGNFADLRHLTVVDASRVLDSVVEWWFECCHWAFHWDFFFDSNPLLRI